MALAQPAIRVPDDAASVVIAVDESASMAPAALRDAQAWIDRALRTRRTADRVGLVAFGGDVRIVQPPTASDVPPRLPDPATLQPGSTDIAEGLRVAAGLVRGVSNPQANEQFRSGEMYNGSGAKTPIVPERDGCGQPVGRARRGRGTAPLWYDPRHR